MFKRFQKIDQKFSELISIPELLLWNDHVSR